MESRIGNGQASLGPTKPFDVGTEQPQAGRPKGQAQSTARTPLYAPPVRPDSPVGIFPFFLQLIVLCGLGLVALIPRIILANQLDLVTDEIIYIITGKSYMPLLRHIATSPWISADAWQLNYEHPPLVKLLIGLSVLINDRVGHPFNELLATRIPSIIAGTALIMVVYWLGRKPFGQVVALLAALSLAFSPWLVYFSSIAYLDMTMTTFITTAYLLTWHATRRPWLYLCVALFVALGIDSKYTAALIIPGILLFTAYYFFVLRSRLPAAQRPPIPWLWWLIAGTLAPLCFLMLDPAIWPNPLHLFKHSLLYEWDHSVGGHLTFLAGIYNLHVPHWAVFYIIANKISAFVTVPAVIFVILALIQLIRFHLGRRLHVGTGVSPHLSRPTGKRETPVRASPITPVARRGQGGPPPSNIPIHERGRVTPTSGGSSPQEAEAAPQAFLFIWMVTMFGMFSLLNIVVGTHYLLPLAPPTVIAGIYTITYLVRQSVRKIARQAKITADARLESTFIPIPKDNDRSHSHGRKHWHAPMWLTKASPLKVRVASLLVIGAIVVGPHLVGLLNTAEAEGYTSEFFHGEDQTLQVAYPGYREAVHWLETDTQGEKRIGLVALPDTLWRGDSTVSWFAYNNNVPKRFHIEEAHPNDTSYPYDYLVWPMHLVQRGNPLPQSWYVIQSIMGGDTTYCLIAANPSSP